MRGSHLENPRPRLGTAQRIISTQCLEHIGLYRRSHRVRTSPPLPPHCQFPHIPLSFHRCLYARTLPFVCLQSWFIYVFQFSFDWHGVSFFFSWWMPCLCVTVCFEKRPFSCSSHYLPWTRFNPKSELVVEYINVRMRSMALLTIDPFVQDNQFLATLSVDGQMTAAWNVVYIVAAASSASGKWR